MLEAGDPYYNAKLWTEPGKEFEIRERYSRDVLPMIEEASAKEERPSAERFIPETMQGTIKAEHEARYRWAAAAVPEKEVLDAGCGVGYGSKILAESCAARVVGLDISPNAIGDAVFRAGSLAEFIVGDLSHLPFPSQSFDVVVCFEAIEHVERGDLVLDEFTRVLRHDGVLLLSSPNRGVYPAGNPYHLHEYTADELEDVLAQRFAKVVLYRQNPHIASLITDDHGLAAKSAAAKLEASVRKVGGTAPGQEVYTLAVAGQGPLPEIEGTAVLTDTHDLGYWIDRASELEKEVTKLERELTALRESLSWRITRPLRQARQRMNRAV